MARKNYAKLYIDRQVELSEVPEKSGGQLWRNTIASQMLKILGLSQHSKPSTIDHSEYDFAVTTLAQLGYNVRQINVKRGTNFWIKIRKPSTVGSYAILGASQWLMVNRDVTLTIVTVGESQYTIPYANVIYTADGIHYVGYTKCPQWILSKHPDFTPWQEPFHGVKSANGKLLGYSELDRLSITNGTPVKVYEKNLENGYYD